MAAKDAVADLKSAVDLEHQLRVSQSQKGVCVLDIYSSEWGACKAITETFKRLYTDASDTAHLRFFTVECNQVLQSLKSSEQALRIQRAKNPGSHPDTLAEGWQAVLEQQQGKSRPLFLLYKEGRRVHMVEGVDTPAIRALVKDLCSVKTPASEYITAPRLLEMWDEQFNPEESEVPVDKFMKGLLAACHFRVAFNDEEKAALVEAIGLSKESKDRIITAEHLQKWFGDDEARTVPQAVNDTVPDYEARAQTVLAEREAEAKRREAEAQARAEEEAEAERKRQEEAAKEPTPQDRIDALSEDIEAIQRSVGVDGREREEEAAARDRVKADDSKAKWVRSNFTTGPMADDTVSERAAELLEAGDLSLFSAMVQRYKASFFSIFAAFDELERKTGAMEGVSPYGRFAAMLSTSNAATTRDVLGCGVLHPDSSVEAPDFADMRPLKQPPSIVASTLTLCTSTDVPASLYVLGDFDAGEDGAVVVPPLTRLSVRAPPGAKAVRLSGLPSVVPLGPLSRAPHEDVDEASLDPRGVFAAPWFAKCAVASDADDGAELTFEGFVAEDQHLALKTKVIEASEADIEKVEMVRRLQRMLDERDALREQLTGGDTNGRVRVVVRSASQFPDAELIGKPDPYVKVAHGDDVHKTPVADDTMSPVWSEGNEFEFKVKDVAAEELRVEIWNDNISLLGDEPIGRGALALVDVSVNRWSEIVVPAPGEKGNPVVTLLVCFMQDDKEAFPAMDAPAAEASREATPAEARAVESREATPEAAPASEEKTEEKTPAEEPAAEKAPTPAEEKPATPPATPPTEDKVEEKDEPVEEKAPEEDKSEVKDDDKSEEKDEVKSERSEEKAPVEEKPKTPEEKPQTPEEEKPKTPEEKPKTPEEKPQTPEEKPKTPEEEKPKTPEEKAAEDEEPKAGGIDWDAIRAKLPTERTAEQKTRRMDLFTQFDPNGNGYLSLAEVDKGCHDVLGLYDIFDAKPVIMRAFQAARGANDKRNKPGSHGPDYIERAELRLLLVYLRQYFELWQMFDRVDASDDRRVDLDEFKGAIAKIEAWGLQIDDAEAEFNAIDTNGGGKILFEEFAHWALAKQLDLEEDDDFEA